jgi:tRNA(adenine34) deaminase
MNDDEKWMQIAISEANLAKSKNEIPVGAVLIQNNELIAQAYNQPISHNDPTAHAEIQVLRIAAKQQSNYRLVGSTIYVTLEPCAMCLGAMMHARIKRIVFGASDPKTGVCGSCANLTSEAFFNHRIAVLGGILEKESKEILQSFFKLRRKEQTKNNY